MQQTMSSLDFLNEVINPARIKAGEKPVRPSDFNARIKDEIDENLNYENFVVGKTGHKTYFTQLNTDQMMLVGMRESKAVRKTVLAYVRKLEKQAGVKEMSVLETAEFLMAALRNKSVESDEKSVETFSPRQIGLKLGKTAEEVNNALVELGYQTCETSRHNGNKVYFRSVTEAGKEYGVNGPLTKTAQHVRWRDAIAAPLNAYFLTL
ncbi:hypothetical protein QEF67_003179 [Klebsiella aerogenes]|uniref:hypothetical protein n=1 Tax=Klebsiella aerogenes TaxID=548 RepID=UPI002A34C9A5|nr:hypothetical protein [Klebsiella aerogenes]